MNLRYDHQIFSIQRAGGISRYYIELIKELSNIEGVVPNLPIFASFNTHWQEWANQKNIFITGKWPLQTTILTYLNQKYDQINHSFQKFDIYHPTYYNLSSLKKVGEKPLVITIHDCTDELFHKNRPEFVKLLTARKAHIERANRIIAISESTKKDLLSFYNINPSVISVIPHGPSFQTISLNSLRNTTQPPYFLFVGHRYEYKGFKSAIEAIIPLCKKNPEIKIKCVGAAPFSITELTWIHNIQLEKNILHQPISSDTQLQDLYTQAIACIYPSAYEGFGMPILEAFASNCPVIIANKGASPETAGNAAIQFDVTAPETLLHVAEKLYKNPTYRLEFIAKGIKRIEDFSWRKTAELTLNAYKQVE